MNLTDTTEASSTITGSLVISGGIGCAKKLYAKEVIPATLTMTNAVTSIDFGTWSQNTSLYYEFLININVDDGVNQLFIDGAQVSTTNTTTMIRTQ